MKVKKIHYRSGEWIIDEDVNLDDVRYIRGEVIKWLEERELSDYCTLNLYILWILCDHFIQEKTHIPYQDPLGLTILSTEQ